MNEHEWLKVPEVAKVLRIARSRAYELIADGEIPAVRIGRSVRINRKELNREGTISRRKNGGWMAQYYVHTAKGRKRKTLYDKTRVEAAEKLSRALSQRADGLVFDDEGLSVGEYLDRWLKEVEDTVRKSTHERYGLAIGPHIKPALGRIKLKDFTPVQVRWFYRERLDSGLAPATVHKLHVVLHKALKAAVADGLVPRNAAAGLKLPRIAREELDPLTEEQAPSSAASCACADKAYDLGEPKTAKSRRTIRLTTNAVTALKAHLSRQLQEMESMGSLYQPGGLIFATESGTIINPSNLRNRSFKPLLGRAKLRPIRFHDLRYSCLRTLTPRLSPRCSAIPP